MEIERSRKIGLYFQRTKAKKGKEYIKVVTDCG